MWQNATLLVWGRRQTPGAVSPGGSCRVAARAARDDLQPEACVKPAPTLLGTGLLPGSAAEAEGLGAGHRCRPWQHVGWAQHVGQMHPVETPGMLWRCSQLGDARRAGFAVSVPCLWQLPVQPCAPTALPPAHRSPPKAGAGSGGSCSPGQGDPARFSSLLAPKSLPRARGLWLPLPQPCGAPEPGGTPRCGGGAERVAWPQRQPAPAESTALAFQSLGLPLGAAENKQTRHRRAGLRTHCLLVLITQECLGCGVLLFFLRLAPPSLCLPPKAPRGGLPVLPARAGCCAVPRG